jgi:catechol 2,3-dioxygenase-like lactoylglutathione lyase family enzyme
MGERTHYQPGTFCWVGLATSDPESAKAFYTSLFGWDAEDLSAGAAGTYTMLRRGGREVAILYRQQPEGARGWRAPALDLLHLGRGCRHDRGEGERPGRRGCLPRALRRA